MLAESPLVKSIQQIIVNIDYVKYLRGSKGESGMAIVKVEFNDRPLGDSHKFEFTADTPCVEVHHSCAINCHVDDPFMLDDIAHKPVLVTVLEVLPKEKKQKEEKVLILGQLTLDLFPFLKGDTNVEYKQQLCPVQGSPLENMPPDAKHPTITATLSISAPLIEEDTMKLSNLMSITIESCYSPPEQFVLNSNHMYTAALPLPLSQDKEYPVVFANGVLKPAVEKEAPVKEKRWPNPAGAQGLSIFIPNSAVKEIAVEHEDGDYRHKDDREHRAQAEIEKNRILWNMERRCYLNASAVTSFQERIAKNRYWPLELFRSNLPQMGKGKSKDDDTAVSHHGICYLNLAPLLYPGVKHIRGAYKVEAYTDHDIYAKTGRKGGIIEEASKIASNIVGRSTASPWPKKGGKDTSTEKAKDTKRGRTSTVPYEEAPKADVSGEFETSAQGNVEGHLYMDAKSYLMVEIELARPLVRKRAPDEVAFLISDIIPPRPMFPKRTDGAEMAVEDYHNQVASVANLILTEFRDMFGDELKNETNPSNEKIESRRHKLIYELNSSGKYFAFKEQLKHSVIKIVREKYLKNTKFTDKDELQAFLSELYVYLVDEMHVSLGKVLATEDQPPIPEPVADSVQLKQFACEAEINKNYDLAGKYYQERIARDRSDPHTWYDYGVFCVYINNFSKAEECFRECVSLDQKHMDGLLMYGIVCTISENYSTADMFFEAATTFFPKSILAWTLRGLFYDAVPNDICAEMAYQEANRLNQQEAIANAEEQIVPLENKFKDAVNVKIDSTPEIAISSHISSTDQGGLAGSMPVINQQSEPEVKIITPAHSKESESKIMEEKLSNYSKRGDKPMSSQLRRPSSMRHISGLSSPHGQVAAYLAETHRDPTPIPASTVFMRTVGWLLCNKAIPFTERCLAHELLAPLGGESCSYYIAYGKLQLQKGDYDAAEEALNEAIKIDFKDPDSWAMVGHANYMKGNYKIARQCYERTLAFEDDTEDPHPVYLRLASIYLHDQAFASAKHVYLRACSVSPSCVTWLGVGIACYRLNELTEAEDALAEANILNNLDAEVWAYLSLVCLKTHRRLEAEQAYKYAIKLNLEDDQLLEEIHNLQEEVGFGNPQM